MKIIIAMFIISCGKNGAVIEDGSPGSASQSATDNSARVSIDLQGFYDAVCEENPLTWSCAKWCIKHYEASNWCGVYDGYCTTDEGKADTIFCLWWSENKPIENKE